MTTVSPGDPTATRPTVRACQRIEEAVCALARACETVHGSAYAETPNGRALLDAMERAHGSITAAARGIH
jgi:hypothetical protein